jgi:hypothetical protein
MRVPFVDLHSQYLSIKSSVDDAIADVIDERDSLKKHLNDAGISTVLSHPKALPFYPA